MNKQAITEEMHLEKEWFEQAYKIYTSNELMAFIEKLMTSYEHDYDTAYHAIGACALACAWYGAHVGGITGRQASLVMWDFIKNWMFENNKCGLKLVDYDDFLYPQYSYKYDKVLNKNTWKAIQKEAIRLLEEEKNDACYEVRKHWKNIADGIVPFGYRVGEDAE